MKTLLLLFLFSLSLMAKDNKTCYSIEVFKKDYTKKNIALAHNTKFPPSCQKMKLGSSIAVRCGCYDYKDEAGESLIYLKKSYKDAKRTLTYKHRFNGKQKKLTIPEEVKPACYSVELYSKKYNSKHLKELSALNFPKECTQFKLGSKLSVRCGCYDDKKEFKKELLSMRKTYKNAKPSLTYAYRFKESKSAKPQVDNSTCYSVELLKRKNNRESIDELSKMNFPSSCVLMNINDLVAMRCGCYDSKKEVIQNYRLLKKEYKNASIRKSYKHKYNLNKESTLTNK